MKNDSILFKAAVRSFSGLKIIQVHIEPVFKTICLPWLNWLYAQLHYFLNLSQLLCFLSAIIGQID